MEEIKDFKTLHGTLFLPGGSFAGIMRHTPEDMQHALDITKVHEISSYLDGYMDALYTVSFLDMQEYRALKEELRAAFSSASTRCINHLAGKE